VIRGKIETVVDAQPLYANSRGPDIDDRLRVIARCPLRRLPQGCDRRFRSMFADKGIQVRQSPLHRSAPAGSRGLTKGMNASCAKISRVGECNAETPPNLFPVNVVEKIWARRLGRPDASVTDRATLVASARIGPETRAPQPQPARHSARAIAEVWILDIRVF